MINLSHLTVFLSISAFMMAAVNLLPAVVKRVQDRYLDRIGSSSRELEKFFVRIKIPHMLGGAVVMGALLGWATGSWVLATSVAVVGLVAPKAVLTIWKSIRSTQFDAQLMDALILIGNALRSGLDIATGVELVTTNMSPPISEEFGLALNTYRLGGSLESALTEMTRRIQSRALETVVSAIILQRETGGNLVKTFDQLVQTIREESKLQKKVKALSAQGRTQVAFLAVFPWALSAVLYFLSPEMIQPALADPWGQAALAGLIVWELIGILVTKKIVTVDV
jgi:tight adherence protein B